MAFEKVRPQVDFPELEKEVLGLWEKIGAFEKSVERRPKERPFVFYEGPPTANGRPGFQLGLSGKDDIERYGVEEFNRLCRESVFRYVEDWRAMTERLGFWIDMDHPYRTLDNPYMQSVWWALKELYEKDLLYEGYKVSAHCPRDQTSLSAAEVALGYETVTDPSVYVRMPLAEDPDTSLLVWTTTPWTLVSNTAVAANPGVEYATVEADGEKLVLA